VVKEGVEARWHGGQELYIGRLTWRVDAHSYIRLEMYIPHSECQLAQFRFHYWTLFSLDSPSSDHSRCQSHLVAQHNRFPYPNPRFFLSQCPKPSQYFDMKTLPAIDLSPAQARQGCDDVGLIFRMV